MKKNIFLDDLRNVPTMPYKFDLVFRTGEEMLDYLEKNPGESYGVIAFDHDLGSNNLNGYETIKRIVNNPNINFTFEKWVCHSDNYVGIKNMVSILVNAKEHGAIVGNEISPYKWVAQKDKLEKTYLTPLTTDYIKSHNLK